MSQELVLRTWNLSNAMVGAADLHLYTTIALANQQNEILAWKSGWAGGKPIKPSRGSMIGPMKAFELIHMVNEDPFAMTPTGMEEGTPWMGGVRRRDERLKEMVTSGSAWSERCDALHALLYNYALTDEVRFHHVGFRHPSEEALQTAVEADQSRFQVVALERPAEDHLRYYLRIVDKRLPNGMYWREHQFFPDGEKTHAVHWDVATSGDLLTFISRNLGKAPNVWDAGENDPWGVHWELNRDGVEYGVMVRDRWVPVEDW